MQVSYDVSRQPHFNRVVEIKVSCTECTRPKFVPLENDKVYKVAVPSYMGSAGDGYEMIKTNAINYHTGKFEVQSNNKRKILFINVTSADREA